MKHFLFLFSSLLFLGEAVLALNPAQPAETLYFYQAYLVEFKTKDYRQRSIAKTCAKRDEPPCTYQQFLRHISSVDSWAKVNKRQDQLEIIDEADKTNVITTCRKLREKNFNVIYDLSQLIEGTRKRSNFGDVFAKINELIKDQFGSDKIAEERKRMQDALKIISEHRIADNMRFFINELQKKLGGIKLVTNPRETLDGFEYKAYDTAETINQMRDKANKIEDADEKAKALKEVDGLSSEIQRLVKDMRSSSFETADRYFKSHQAVIREAKETMRQLKKAEKC